MREKLSSLDARERTIRITPAYAGKTLNYISCELPARDHPRVCGKNYAALNSGVVVRGSPPRMREKLLRRLSPSCLCRITPAYAGKTIIRPGENQKSRDHLRVCGKNSLNKSTPCNDLGSPPRMREKHCKRCGKPLLYGITPAYAGKTGNYRQKVQVFKDHPRVCGKNVSFQKLFY